MINLNQEENAILSSREKYDILSFAIDAAEDSGFLNSFVFERAIYCYAAILLMEDSADKIREAMKEGLIECWDMLIKEDILQEMVDQYEDELNDLANLGRIWFDEYNNYILSARGVLSFAEQFSGDIIAQAASRLKETMEESGAENVIELADKWGMNNSLPQERESKPYEEKDIESLFV